MVEWRITAASHSTLKDAFLLDLGHPDHGDVTAVVEMEWEDDRVHKRSYSGHAKVRSVVAFDAPAEESALAYLQAELHGEVFSCCQMCK